MNGTSSGFDAESRPTGNPQVQDRSLAKRRRLIKHEGERIGAGARTGRAGFEGFAESLRGQIAPTDLLESILADRVILSAWRLKGASQAEENHSSQESPKREVSPAVRLKSDPLNESRREGRAAERSLRRALGDLDRYRDRRCPQWGKAQRTDPREAPRPAFDHDPDARPALPSVSNEWPVLPNHPDRPASCPPSHEPIEPSPWRDRLVYDFNVSESSPVVKGTWVTVNHLVSLIVDGWTWADILRSHPELSEDDIRTCLAFATEEESVGV